jgi:hypothetical protein
MDDPDDPDYGFNVWYNGKIEYEGFDEDWGHVFGFTMYDEDGDEIRWSDIYKSLKTGPDTDALDYEWINIKDAGQLIKFVGGKRRKKRTRKKRGGRNETNQNIYYIIQNNAENIRRFQEQVFSPDANAEDAEGFNNLIFMLENMQRLDAGGFWIVEYSLTRDLDDNYHHYHLAWENNIPDINDNPDLENAIRFINDEQNGGGKRHKKKTRRKKGGNGKDNKTKKKKETKCAGIRNAFGQCMTAAKKTTTFNKSVIDAQDTSLGQFKTDNPSILMGFPSGKGGGRKKKGGLLGPRELEEGRQYLYTGPEPHFMPQAEWQTPVRITVTYRGRNVPGLTPNRHYFDGEREIARDGHSLDIFSLDNANIEQHIQPWVQNSGPSRVTNPSGVYAPRPRRESTCENCTIMGGGKQRRRP